MLTDDEIERLVTDGFVAVRGAIPEDVNTAPQAPILIGRWCGRYPVGVPIRGSLVRLGLRGQDVAGAEQCVLLASAAPYEVSALEQVLRRGGIATRRVENYDAITGQERVNLSVTRRDVDRANAVLFEFRRGP